MKDEIKSTEINVNKENIIPIADVKQESQCVLTLELYKDNVAFDITGQTVKLGAKTADGNVQLQESGFTINKNILTVDLKSSINSVVGLLEIDLTFTDSTGIMTTSSFYLNVIKKTLGKDNIIASNQLEAVKVLIEDLKTKGNNTIADIKKDYDSLKKAIIDNNVAANLQNQINQNKQQSVENTNRIEQLEDLTPVWQEHSGVGNITVNDSFDGISKDLVIKGKTLKNLGVKKNGHRSGTISLDNLFTSYKKNAEYTLVINVKNRTGEDLDGSIFSITYEDDSNFQPNPNFKFPLGISKFKIPAKNLELKAERIPFAAWFRNPKSDWSVDIEISIFEGNIAFEGEYFDSIMSSGEQEDNKIKIKSVGKNLFNKDKFIIGDESLYGYQKIEFNGINTLSIKEKDPSISLDNIYFGFTPKGVNADGEVYWLISAGNIYHTKASREEGYISIHPNTKETLNKLLQRFDIQLESGSVATNYEQYRSKLIEIPLPFAKGLKSTLDGTIYDEINGNTGEIIQRVSEEYTELPKENIYKIPKDYLRFFNGTTNILQENNITSILKFEYPLNKDASIVSGLLINDILESEIKNNNNNISELNTKLTENKNDIDYLDSKITTSTNNITTLNSKVTTNTNSINNLKTELAKHNIQTNPLWEGASFLAAGQELTLNKSLDNCRNGVVLVWSQYNTSTNVAINEYFAFVFIRKNTIVQNANRCFGCLIANAVDRISSYDHIITKYVNVSGTRVVGWRGNNQYQNAQSVLRAVYEW